LRESERSEEYAEYKVRFDARADLLDLRTLVAASVGATPILTRLTSARGPIQKSGFLINVRFPNPSVWDCGDEFNETIHR